MITDREVDLLAQAIIRMLRWQAGRLQMIEDRKFRRQKREAAA